MSTIVSHPANQNYRDHFDETFGKKEARRPQPGDTISLMLNAGGVWCDADVRLCNTMEMFCVLKRGAYMRWVNFADEGTTWRWSECK